MDNNKANNVKGKILIKGQAASPGFAIGVARNWGKNVGTSISPIKPGEIIVSEGQDIHRENKAASFA